MQRLPPGPEHPRLRRSPRAPSEDVLGIAAAPSHPPHATGLTPLPSDAAFQIAEVKLG